MSRRCLLAIVAVLVVAFVQISIGAETKAKVDFPFFAYLTGSPTPRLVSYSPSELDPRFPGNHDFLTTGSIRTDLKVLRPVFDGLVLYGCNKSSTPRILAVAKELKYRAVLIGIWQPKSDSEIDGVAALVGRYHADLALGVIVGNEGITFHRYGPEDLTTAAVRLRGKIPKTIPLTTSEPLVGYRSEAVRQFGDFLAANIHPVFDAPHLDAAEAAAWARRQAENLARQANKPLLLKETGFPHGGKEGFTLETQKTFWESYLKPGIVARLDDSPDVWIFHGVAFEAFDLAWKTEASNLAIEEYWGLLSKGRESYGALSTWETLLPRHAETKPNAD
ncbi:MAG: exo-beta-1,3-glucanase [Planctomycetota bacterium]